MSGLYLKSTAFADGGQIPRMHGYNNGNHIPPLSVGGVPQGSESLALIVDDPDALKAVGKVWVHWIAWNIPPGASRIEQSACVEGTTDFGKAGYGGPAPPDKRHTYSFRLYALDCMLELAHSAHKTDLEEAMRGHIIQQAVLYGTYDP